MRDNPDKTQDETFTTPASAGYSGLAKIGIDKGISSVNLKTGLPIPGTGLFRGDVAKIGVYPVYDDYEVQWTKEGIRHNKVNMKGLIVTDEFLESDKGKYHWEVGVEGLTEIIDKDMRTEVPFYAPLVSVRGESTLPDKATDTEKGKVGGQIKALKKLAEQKNSGSVQQSSKATRPSKPSKYSGKTSGEAPRKKTRRKSQYEKKKFKNQAGVSWTYEEVVKALEDAGTDPTDEEVKGFAEQYNLTIE